MNIIECKEMQRIKKHELIPTVIDHIFTICKEDKNFTIQERIGKIDSRLTQANTQISKHKKLLNQSNKIKKELLEKIKAIDDESFKIKYKVLETLGSDI
jgi:transposase